MDTIQVGLGTCGISAGGEAVYETLKETIIQNRYEDSIQLCRTGCMGLCYAEVLVSITIQEQYFLYTNVTPEKAIKIFEEHIIQKKPIDEWYVYFNKNGLSTFDLFPHQKRIVMHNCGFIDPESIIDYQQRQGYMAYTHILENTKPDMVIDIVKQSGLRGRGGGGFHTGKKWYLARQNEAQRKYIICNADEGDPGAFMDRSLLESDPHSVIEGMIIAGYAIGAQEGIVYIRAEYPLAIQRVEKAIDLCRKHGYIGKNILNSGFNFELFIKRGAGAFVCGEETALIASIEGKRGIPRIRPPFPAQKGLWNHPTNINNVETYAVVPWIMRNGASAFAKYGTEKSCGTKIFSLAGKIKRSGLIEVPMGISIKDIVFTIGGGMKNDTTFKAIQIGGPSGGCIPANMSSLKIDYDEITRTGAIMGSGGLIVLDDTTCMVELARFFLEFTQSESCGKCTFCRIGTKRMLEILERITRGDGTIEDIDTLKDLGEQIKTTSLCGLGQTAPNPVLTTINYFRKEYEAHIKDKKCPARTCTALIQYKIFSNICTGCQACIGQCPVNAIQEYSGQLRVDLQVCTKCGLCQNTCKFGAIMKI